MTEDGIDERGLIREAFRIDGITLPECRTIFLDWALSLPEGVDTDRAVHGLLERHEGAPEDHPMLVVLREARSAAPPAGRRGGRAGRVS